MMKKLIRIFVGALTLAASLSAAYANPVPNTGSFPHILSTVQFPPTKWGIVRHSFRLQIPQNSSALSQINIDCPPGLNVRNDFNLSDQFDREIQVNTSVNGNKITMAFAQPFASGNVLNIDMNRVNRTGTSNAWLYRVSVKFVGSDAEIPIGVAQFRLY